MIALLFSTAYGVNANVDYCVKFNVEFERAYEPGGAYSYGAGAHWSNNAIDQPARNLWIEVQDYYQTHTAQLDSQGCTTLTVSSPFASVTTTVTVLNEATFGDVEVRLRQGPKTKAWVFMSSPSVTFTKVVVTNGSSKNLIVPATEGWQHMAIATWMLHRQDLRLEDPTNRDCCLESGTMDDDGTCSGGSPDPYTRLADPYLTTQPIVALRAWTDNTGGCCASKGPWLTSPGPQESSVGAGKNQQNRFAISHEFGHMLAGIRMGGFEAGQYPNNVADDTCNGDQNNGLPVPDNKRGIFTKEFGSTAFREGWAEFVKAWAWNNNVSAPEVCSFNQYNYDLDADIDSFYGVGHPYDRCYELGGRPEIATQSGDPTAPWARVFVENWLEAAIDNGACEEVGFEAPAVCNSNTTRQATMERYNRSTVYDIANLYWQMYHDEGVSPDEVLDLYIDMCPRGWRESDANSGTNQCLDRQDLPYRRAGLAGYASGTAIGTVFEDAVDAHMEH